MDDQKLFNLLLIAYQISVYDIKDADLSCAIEWTLIPLSDHIIVTEEQSTTFETTYDEYLILIGVS